MTVSAPSSNGASTTSRPAAPRPIQRPTSALELIRTPDRAEVPPATIHESAAAPQVHPAQPSGFSHEQLAALAAPSLAAIVGSLQLPAPTGSPLSPASSVHAT